MPDLRLPDGRIVKNIPEGISKQQIEQKLIGSGYLTGEEEWLTPKMSAGEAAFTTATNPLGFGDEIKAGIAAGVAKLFGGAAIQNIDIGDLYREARTAERAKLQKARQDRPLTSFAGQVFSDVGVAGKGLKALGLAGQGFGTAVKGGAALGGASALGETEDLTNIPQTLKDVATGIGVGGVVGGAVQQAIPAAQNAIPAMSGMAKKGLQKVFGVKPEAVKTFQELGIEPTLADVSNSAGLQNFIKDVPLAGKPITEALQKQVNDISGQIQNVISVKPKTYARTGKMIKEGAEEFEKFAGQRVSNLYDDLDRQILNETQEMTSNKLSSAIDEWVKLKDLQSELQRSIRGNSKAAALIGSSPEYSKEYKSLLDLKSELESSVKGNLKIVSLINQDASQKLGFWRKKTRATGSEFLTAAADDARNLDNVNKQLAREAKNLKPRNAEFLSNAAEDAKNLNNVNKQISKQLKLISKYEKYLSPQQLKSVLATGEVTVPTSNTLKSINEFNVENVAAISDGVSRIIGRYKNIVDEAGNMPYPQLRMFRTTIGQRLQSPTISVDERAALNTIYSSLSEDMKDAVALYGGTKGLQAFDKANTAFKRKTEFIENIIDPVLKANTATKAYKKAISPLKEDATIAKNLMLSLKPIQQEYVRASIVRDMGLVSKAKQGAEADVFSPQKFMAEYSVLKKNGVEKHIFTPEQVTAYNRLNKVVELTKNTEQAGKKNMLLPTASLLSVGIPTTGIGLIPLMGGGRFISSQMMANPKFINWLAVTAQSTPKELPKHLNRLSVITAANPEIREEVLEFISSMGMDQAQAKDGLPTEDEFKNQLLKQKQDYPSIAGDVNVEQEVEKYKKRYLK